MLTRLTCFTAVAAVGLSVSMASVSTARAEDKVLNVYNWSDYIAKDTLEKFTKETGIKVKYDTYGENEVLDTKLLTGKSGYDVVFPSTSPFFAKQVEAKVFLKLDYSKLPNAVNLDKDIMGGLAKFDPEHQYGLPYLAAATGIGYNVDAIKKIAPDLQMDSWKILFDPATVAKLASCGVVVLDTPTESVPIVQLLQGKDPHLQTAEALDEAMKTLLQVRPSLRYVNSEKYRADLANGDICMALGYVGDLVQSRNNAQKAERKQNIGIVIPKEGAIVNVDVMAIPADAPHPEEALAFINFILRPDIIADITNETGYANAVPASLPLVDPAIRDDAVIYPPAEMKAKLFPPTPPASRDYNLIRARAWTKFRKAKG